MQFIQFRWILRVNRSLLKWLSIDPVVIWTLLTIDVQLLSQHLIILITVFKIVHLFWWTRLFLLHLTSPNLQVHFLLVHIVVRATTVILINWQGIIILDIFGARKNVTRLNIGSLVAVFITLVWSYANMLQISWIERLMIGNHPSCFLLHSLCFLELS